MNSYFQGVWRMDWGLGNPNKTAALIATLMVAVWVLAYVRKWGFWAALALFTGLGVCLIHTFSRGGVIAVFAGLIPLMIYSPQPWSRYRVIAITVSVWIVIGFSFYWGAHKRYARDIQNDRSIASRLEIWETAPRMMCAAPGGWGWGNSGNAYMQWYQSLDHGEQYRTLVNSHLTWLVEMGWPLRFLYILAWFSVLMLCWPSKEYRGLAFPFGIWIAFAVGVWFSSVAESLWLWVVPSVGFVAMLLWRIRRNVWPRPKVALLPVGLAGLITLGLFLCGRGNTEIHASAERVVIGRGNPQIWLVADTENLGDCYGKTLRQFLQTGGAGGKAIALVKSVTRLGDVTGQTVILAAPVSPQEMAKVKAVFASAKKVTLVNPRFFPGDVDLSVPSSAMTEAVFGEFSESPAIKSWEGFAAVRRIEGAGNFLPHWPEVILAHQS